MSNYTIGSFNIQHLNNTKDFEKLAEIIKHGKYNMNNNLIAYCGVDCSACVDYLNFRCPGCRFSPWIEEDICAPVKCCRDRNLDYCGECKEFPCEMMEEFYEESDSHREARERMLQMAE